MKPRSSIASLWSFLCGAAFACFAAWPADTASAQSFGFDPPSASTPKTPLRLWATRYWVHAANASNVPGAVGLRGPQGVSHGIVGQSGGFLRGGR